MIELIRAKYADKQMNPKRCYYEVWDKESRQMVYCGKKAVEAIAVGGFDVDFTVGGFEGITPLCEEHLPQVKLALFNKDFNEGIFDDII